MSKHDTLKPRKFTIEFCDSRRARAHGGQLAISGLLEQYGLKQRVAAERSLEVRTHKGKGFAPLVYVSQLLYSFTSGGVSLADAERLNDDGPLLALLGLEKFPDQTAVGEWLRDLGEPGWQALRRLSRDFVQWAFERAKPARYQHAGRTECFFDDTQIELSGSTFEGAAINYEGNLSLSWQVLLCGPFVADQILGATSNISARGASAITSGPARWNRRPRNCLRSPGRPWRPCAGATTANTPRNTRGFDINPVAAKLPNASAECASVLRVKCSAGTPS